MRQAEEASCSAQPCSASTSRCSAQTSQHGAERQCVRQPIVSPASLVSPAWSGRHQHHRRHQQQWRAGLLLALLAAALLQPACCAAPRGDAQDRAFEDLSILARAGKPLTQAAAADVGSTAAAEAAPVEAAPVETAPAADTADAVSGPAVVEPPAGGSGIAMADAPISVSTSPVVESAAGVVSEADGAHVIVAPAAEDRHAEHLARKVEKRALLMPDTQVSQSGVKKPSHGGVPSWFKGAGAHEAGTKHELEGNRRMLRRQKGKGHFHSVEDEWLKVHRRYVEELEKEGEWDVLFYGDSIMEEWRGTFLGAPWGAFADVKKVWAEFFETKPYKAQAFGIAGDKVEQLLWRLENGELPAARQPKVVVVMIGTNDLVGECNKAMAEETGNAVVQLLQLVHAQMPGAHVVSLALLPKGEVWPNRCSDAITAVNAQLEAWAAESAGFAHFLDLGAGFLSAEPVAGKLEVKEALMPDSLHPSAVGMRIVAAQLEPLVAGLVASHRAPDHHHAEGGTASS